MNKWIAIPVISVLAVGLIVGGYFLWQQTDKLGEAKSEIVALENTVSAREGDISTLEGNVSTLQGKLTDSEAEVSTLEADLENAQNALQAQQNINLALSEELKTVKDPRHFASLTELTDWLREDDTDTKYADESYTQQSFILQVRALRDGYLLPVSLYIKDGFSYVINRAVIEDSIYAVWAEDDYTSWYDYQIPLPSHPLPLD